MTNLEPLVVMLLVFGATAGFFYVAGQLLKARLRLQQRAAGSRSGTSAPSALLENMNAIVSNYFDEKRFGLQGTVRGKLRRDLVRAGYFRVDAVNYYIFVKLAVVVVVPFVAYLAAEALLFNRTALIKLSVVVIATAVAILGPDAYIARRQRVLTERYRVTFPDLLDLMVVCVDAGLSLEAAFDRVSNEIAKRNRELGLNLLLFAAETRAGRATTEALKALADRLGFDEARAFVATLDQSIELGTDIGDAMRIFSDEMRDKRLFRAEERANQLPVKMVLPLGLFIFPVILGVVMLPVILRLLTVMKLGR
jgi:tight adherence protein C